MTNAGYFSPYGKTLTRCPQTDGNSTLNIIIPANTSATIYLPAQNGDKVESDGATLLRADDDSTLFFASSGSCHFICTHPNH
jgi:alpha-L-rhamnosidase